MLVLSRRPNEAIAIPGLNITIRVAAIKGGAVRIGVEAPPDVSILRAELLGRVPSPAALDAEPTCLAAAS